MATNRFLCRQYRKTSFIARQIACFVISRRPHKPPTLYTGLTELHKITTDLFSGPDRAIGSVYVCVCVSGQ